jgi:hypothetical protein
VHATYLRSFIAPSYTGISATDVVNELVTDVSAVDKRVTAMEARSTRQHDAGLDQVDESNNTVE